VRALGDASAAERQRQARQAEAEKQARDRELNRERALAAQRKAEASALRQLIHEHRVLRDGGEIAYHFTDGTALKRLYVTAQQQRALVAGTLAIVRQEPFYELIPADIAERVRARDAALLLVWNRDGSPAASPTDETDYPPVPDDLMW